MSPQKKKLEAALDNLFSSPHSKARTATAKTPEDSPSAKTRKPKVAAARNPQPDPTPTGSEPTGKVQPQVMSASQSAPDKTTPESITVDAPPPAVKTQDPTPAMPAIVNEPPTAEVPTGIQTPLAVTEITAIVDPPVDVAVPESVTVPAPVVTAPSPTPAPAGKAEPVKVAAVSDEDPAATLNGYTHSNGSVNAKGFADLQLVVFTLDSQSYGVEITYVDSIIKIQAITPIPHSRSEIKGVTNLRGRVLPVVDLRTRFGLPEIDNTRNSRIIVIHIHKTEVGMLVDAVSEVMTLPATDVEPVPSITTSIDSDYVTGVAKVDDRLVIMLDVAKILAIQDEEK